MSEIPTSNEEGPESIPTLEDVLSVIEQVLDGAGYEIKRQLEDEQGLLYLLEIKVTGKDEDIEYLYMRKGRYAVGGAGQSHSY